MKWWNKKDNLILFLKLSIWSLNLSQPLRNGKRTAQLKSAWSRPPSKTERADQWGSPPRALWRDWRDSEYNCWTGVSPEGRKIEVWPSDHVWCKPHTAHHKHTINTAKKHWGWQRGAWTKFYSDFKPWSMNILHSYSRTVETHKRTYSVNGYRQTLRDRQVNSNPLLLTLLPGQFAACRVHRHTSTQHAHICHTFDLSVGSLE